jgi:ABC-type lipopolysaccharide export system ATPase subunit
VKIKDQIAACQGNPDQLRAVMNSLHEERKRKAETAEIKRLIKEIALREKQKQAEITGRGLRARKMKITRPSAVIITKFDK